MIVNPALEVLRRGMKSIGMTQLDLFEDYRELGGRVKQPNTIGAWLRGERDIPYTQMTLLFRAVNLRLLQKGKPPIEIPFRNGLVTDDQPAATGTVGSNAPELEVIEGRQKPERVKTDVPFGHPSYQQQIARPAA